MNIVIVGAGVVGSNLAEELSQAGHVVSIVDRNPELVQRVSDRMDVLAVAGNAGKPSVLRKAGIQDAEMVIAVTNIDEVNLVICLLAAQLGVRHKIARIRHDEYSGQKGGLDPSRLGIDSVISPERLLTDTLRRIVETPGATDVAAFAGGKVLLVSFAVSGEAPVAGKKLLTLRDMAAMDAFLVVAIYRKERTIIPRGDDTIEPGDHISVLVNRDTLPLLLPLIQRRVEATQRVILAGAGLTGLTLARELEGRLDRVVLIEPDPQRAREAARELRHGLVLQGEPTDVDLLREADVSRCDLFAALTDNDQDNLLGALMARRHGARRVAVMAQDPTYLPALADIGLDVVVNPRLATVGEILRYIRKGPVQHVTRMREGGAEVMEITAQHNTRVVGRPLKELEFPNGCIIGAVVRNEEMIIPTGDFVMEGGDLVVVFALPPAIPKLEKLFARRMLFGRRGPRS